MTSNEHFFGYPIDTTKNIQRILNLTIVDLHIDKPEDLTTRQQAIFTSVINALAETSANPRGFDPKRECLVCGNTGHTFDSCPVLNDFHFLKLYMQELALLWNRLNKMVN